MSNLVVRGLSGLVYVLLILGATFFIPQGSFYLAALFGLLALIEWQQFKPDSQYRLYTGLSISILLISMSILYPKEQGAINGVLGFINVLLILWIAFHSLLSKPKKENALESLFRNTFGLVYLILPLLALAAMGDRPWVLAGVFIMIWCFDSFAYLSGRLLGKHKMSPNISPNKTWEGFAGGALFASLAGYLLHLYAGESTMALWHWLILAILVVFSATLGDLFESALKRNHGKKDSGKLMPGHGGILDRIDSLLVAMPVAYLFLKLVASNSL